jgi:hypothetical protein
MKPFKMNLCDKECRRFQTKEYCHQEDIREKQRFDNYLRWNYYKIK